MTVDVVGERYLTAGGGAGASRLAHSNREGRAGDVLLKVPPTSPAPMSPKLTLRLSLNKPIKPDSVKLACGGGGGGDLASESARAGWFVDEDEDEEEDGRSSWSGKTRWTSK